MLRAPQDLKHRTDMANRTPGNATVYTNGYGAYGVNTICYNLFNTQMGSLSSLREVESIWFGMPLAQTLLPTSYLVGWG